VKVRIDHPGLWSVLEVYRLKVMLANGLILHWYRHQLLCRHQQRSPARLRFSVKRMEFAVDEYLFTGMNPLVKDLPESGNRRFFLSLPSDQAFKKRYDILAACL